jgi:hypothetical protein
VHNPRPKRRDDTGGVMSRQTRTPGPEPGDRRSGLAGLRPVRCNIGASRQAESG